MSTETATRTVSVTNRHGLHARPSMAIVKTVQKYDARVTVHRNGQNVDAANIFDLLLLGATQGTELVLSAEGRQAAEVLEALARLFDAEFEVDYRD